MIEQSFKLSLLADPAFASAAQELSALPIDAEDAFNFAVALHAASEATVGWKEAHVKAMENSGGIRVETGYQMDATAQAKYFVAMQPLEEKEHTLTLPRKIVVPRAGKIRTSSLLLFLKFVELAPAA